jgi:uncharacterized protein YjbJ (UPF0337 family)
MSLKDEAQGTWNQLAGAVRTKYAQITGDDVAGAEGNIQHLAGVIQKKTGKAREEIEEFLQTISDNTTSTVGRMSEAANDMASRAGETIREGYDYARDASRDGIKAATETVQHRPGESMLLAMGVGVVAGLIIGSTLCKGRS